MDAPRQAHPLNARLRAVLWGLRAGAVLIAASAGLKCAHVEPPSGGPIDSLPPAVTAVFPAPGARYVPANSPVVFRFSEWIDRTASRTEVFLSPPLSGRLRTEVDGDRFVIRFPRPLRPNTTYRVTVLGTLKDLHGVAMGKKFSLGFSTGAGPDSGSLPGSVFSTDPKGTLMAALYRRNARSLAEPVSRWDTAFRPDTLPQPWRELPAFVATADSGGFAFDSVNQGDYALLAFQDLNGNFVPDVGSEPLAVGEPFLSLRPRAAGRFLRTAPLDTTPLRVLSAEFAAAATRDSLTYGTVRLQFTRAPHPDSAADARRYLLLGDSGSVFPVAAAGWDDKAGAWALQVPPLRAGKRYRVALTGAPDFKGGSAAGKPDTSVFFPVEKSKDSVAKWELAFLQKPGPSGLPVTQPSAALLPADAYLLSSSLALDTARWRMLQTRLVVTAGDTVPLKVRLERSRPPAFSLRLPKPLPPGSPLQLRLKPVADDSAPVLLASGTVLDSGHLGGIRFRVPPRWRGWTFWVQGSGAEYLLAPGDSGTIGAPSLPTGRYALYAFQDRDKDGLWYPGSLVPWIPQEPSARVLPLVDVKPGETGDLTDSLGR